MSDDGSGEFSGINVGMRLAKSNKASIVRSRKSEEGAASKILS
jgi:hypothetical protein